MFIFKNLADVGMFLQSSDGNDGGGGGQKALIRDLLGLSEEPSEPTKPAEPTEPTEPTEPSEPTEPTEPTEPEPSDEPAEPTEPEEPAEPVEPSEPDEPAEPAEPEEPAYDPEYVRKLEQEINRLAQMLSGEVPTTEPAGPDSPPSPAEPAQPTLPAQPVSPQEPAAPTAPVAPVQLQDFIDDETFEEIRVDRTKFNEVLNKVGQHYTQFAVQEALRQSLPVIVEQARQVSSAQIMLGEFWKQNEDLEPFRPYVELTIRQTAATNPQKPLLEILEETERKVREALRKERQKNDNPGAPVKKVSVKPPFARTPGGRPSGRPQKLEGIQKDIAEMIQFSKEQGYK